MALSVDALAVEALSVDGYYPLKHCFLSVEGLQYPLTLLHLYKITRHEIFTISPPICISTSSQHDL